MPAEAPAAQHARPRKADAAAYEHLDAAERYLHVTRDQHLVAVLQRHAVSSLAGLRILELGCGEGSLLRTLIHYGADAGRLGAVDVDVARVGRARASLPDVRLAAGDIASLPYREGAFDLAFAFTVLTSVLDDGMRRQGAAEALRVLRPGGLLIVYDFWVNPFNRRVRSLRAAELRDLFTPRRVEVAKVTLAPPVVRALGGRCRLCRPLERLPFLRTHLMAAVVKENSPV